MDALAAIAQRRMIPRVGDRRPSRADILELLDLAVRAPNHHRTEPWRFTVVAGDELDRIARAIADEDVASNGTPPGDALDAARKKVARAPVIIVVGCVPSPDPAHSEQEDMASVAMAIQNILIAAHAKGLGVMLRTGPAASHPAMREHLDLEDGEQVVGLLYLGYPDAPRALTERTPAPEKTRWLGW